MSIIEQTIPEPLAEPFEVESDPRREVLWRAADLIEERGHCKGRYVGEHGELCMRAAVYVAEGLDSFRVVITPAISALYRAVDGSVVDWNDAPGRTKEEVVARLRELAEGPLS